ncbi:MAG: hypothetical protein ACE15C_17140 [Phycisphaerae bacterium]
MHGVRRNDKAFVLVLVLIMIVMAGSALVVMTAISNDMAWRSDRAYYDACGRNLVASGQAWAAANAKAVSAARQGQPRSLDVSPLPYRGAKLSVSVGSSADGKAQLQVSSECGRGSRIFRRNAVVGTSD